MVLPAGAAPSVAPRPAIGRTRAGLVDGAGRAFAELGVRGATMQAVAAAAGVSKATLYNHFRTKDELAGAFLAGELDRLTALAAQLPPVAAIAALSDELAGHPVLRRLAEDEPDLLSGLLRPGDERWADVVARLGAALGARVDGAEILARWLTGVVLHPGRSIDRHRQAARLAAAVGAPEDVEHDAGKRDAGSVADPVRIG
jgi:AcrR family transcriptional regulator